MFKKKKKKITFYYFKIRLVWENITSCHSLERDYFLVRKPNLPKIVFVN